MNKSAELAKPQRLRLAKSELFGETTCDFWQREDGEVFMTINQLSQALGYVDRSGVDKIVQRNEYLTEYEFSVQDKLSGTDGKQYETRIFTEDGIYELTMLSRTQRAREFRSWVRGVLKALRKGETLIAADHLTQQPQALATPKQGKPIFSADQEWLFEINPTYSTTLTYFPARRSLLKALANIRLIEENQLRTLFGVTAKHIFGMLSTGELVRHELLRDYKRMTVYSLGLKGCELAGVEPKRLENEEVSEVLQPLVFFEYCCYLQDAGIDFEIETADEPFVGLIHLLDGTLSSVLVLQRKMSLFELSDYADGHVTILAADSKYLPPAEWFETQTVVLFSEFMESNPLPCRENDPFGFETTF